ncbi:MAG: preprotein translocase subunit YajC [Acidobacteriaceae bacterium]|nr:preprotein translocase subunit YajC [Acidobacteriaceae bacterium]MBV9778407.1 preprotein translocase subunit YajC [Acidobacteriaceae bacterium]
MPDALVLLQAAPSSPFVSGLLPIVLMIGIFYFLVFMPMRRQQRNQKEMLKSLIAGQTVITTGGIIGTIVTVADDTLILRVKPDNVKIQVSRSAVTNVVKTDEQVKK